MLLIWDIHLTSKIKDKLINSLKSFIQKHNKEKNLIFLWDFVYHFSYDRNALLELYDLFLELYSQWKNLYILAWNHDRLGNTFVFEEGRKAFEVLSKVKNLDNEICFITKPFVKEIEWKNICFLPAMLEFDEKDYPWIEKLRDETYKEEKRNKNIAFSNQLNLVVERFTKKYSDLILIHHYYIEWVSFPWQKAKFSFKDRALSQRWLDEKWVLMVSWHLHQPFSYKNYLCIWSVWATSPLEADQIKYLWSFNNWHFDAWESWINYYFTMERKKWNADLFTQEYKAVTWDDVVLHRHSLQKKSEKNFDSSLIWIETHFQENLSFKDVSLSLFVEKLQYENISEYINSELQQQLQDTQLKKDIWSTEELLEQLDKPDMAGELSFWNWLELLKNFLKKQYPEEYEEYEKLLQDIKIL